MCFRPPVGAHTRTHGYRRRKNKKRATPPRSSSKDCFHLQITMRIHSSRSCLHCPSMRRGARAEQHRSQHSAKKDTCTRRAASSRSHPAIHDLYTVVPPAQDKKKKHTHTHKHRNLYPPPKMPIWYIMKRRCHPSDARNSKQWLVGPSMLPAE